MPIYTAITMSIRFLLKNIIPFNLRLKIKKIRKRTINSFKRGVTKTSINDMHKLLVEELNIKKGDNLIVSSSFGNLNANYSPKNLVELLQKIVGKEGNLVMPFYPPGNSFEWAESGQIFDMQITRSSMGILTQVFSEMPNVFKSMHPTKAVVAWGKNAEEIVKGHENSKTPFYWDSPYGWLLQHSSKSLGLGVRNRPIIHACEDCIIGKSKYLNNYYKLKVKSINAIIDVNTLIHNPRKMYNISKNNLLLQKLGMNSLIIKTIGFSSAYIFVNQELFLKYKIDFDKKIDF